MVKEERKQVDNLLQRKFNISRFENLWDVGVMVFFKVKI